MPGSEVFYQEMPDGQVDFRAPFFGHTSHHAVWGDQVVWAVTDTFQLNVHDREGRRVMIIRKDQPVRRVRDDEIQPLIEQRVVAVRDPAWRPLVRKMYEAVPRGTMPVLGGIAVDDEGNLWVASYAEPGDTANVRFVFEREGTWLGAVTLPRGFAPRHIGADVVLGRWRDSLDVEHLQLRRLRRGR